MSLFTLCPHSVCVCFLVVCVTGYSFLPAQAEIFARQQELLRKQNLARCVLQYEILKKDYHYN